MDKLYQRSGITRLHTDVWHDIPAWSAYKCLDIKFNGASCSGNSDTLTQLLSFWTGGWLCGK